MAARVRDALELDKPGCDAFLVSNELWGGAGSIADQAGLGSGRGSNRLDIENALISLGRRQLSIGKANLRTDMWVSTFESWAAHGILHAFERTRRE
jgi:hypothetical protein